MLIHYRKIAMLFLALTIVSCGSDRAVQQEDLYPSSPLHSAKDHLAKNGIDSDASDARLFIDNASGMAIVRFFASEWCGTAGCTSYLILKDDKYWSVDGDRVHTTLPLYLVDCENDEPVFISFAQDSNNKNVISWATLLNNSGHLVHLESSETEIRNIGSCRREISLEQFVKL